MKYCKKQKGKDHDVVELHLLWTRAVCTDPENRQITMPEKKLALLVILLGQIHKDELPVEYTAVWEKILQWEKLKYWNGFQVN